MKEAIALYDFEAQLDTEEISFVAGDRLQIFGSEDDEGWLEGKNPEGEVGIFPAAYVQILEISLDPPSPPSTPQILPGEQMKIKEAISQQQQDERLRSISHFQPKHQPPMPPLPPPPPNSPQLIKEWDDMDGLTAMEHVLSNKRKTPSLYSKKSFFFPVNETDWLPRKNLNLFSPFVKSGCEHFLRNGGKEDAGVLATGPVKLEKLFDRFQWSKQTTDIKVEIPEFSTVTKFAGTKTLTMFHVHTQMNGENFVAHRRYKHFLWLHQQLQEAYPLILLPKFPEKEQKDRLEAHFIFRRQRALAYYLKHLTRHPLLSSSFALEFFLQAEMQNVWKEGKRKVEQLTEQRRRQLGFFMELQSRFVPEKSESQISEVFQEFKRFKKQIQPALNALVNSGFALHFGSPTLRNIQLKNALAWSQFKPKEKEHTTVALSPLTPTEPKKIPDFELKEELVEQSVQLSEKLNKTSEYQIIYSNKLQIQIFEKISFWLHFLNEFPAHLLILKHIQSLQEQLKDKIPFSNRQQEYMNRSKILVAFYEAEYYWYKEYFEQELQDWLTQWTALSLELHENYLKQFKLLCNTKA